MAEVLIAMVKRTTRACGLTNLATVTISEIFYGVSVNRSPASPLLTAYCPVLESRLLHNPQTMDNDR